ncbi:hypothetical protein [Microbacterium oleivorans]|uniref:Uncharacterized protein n=1 Tax=Microbacterium oleivorans TaxID=273677 RepID=A0A7D5JEN3_9MICO|nr:hypothetical protein [Microbacterium oleivorans]QLD13000.1 hypothetical protein HW566_15150 [Microbacterium oleivorans]
MTETGAPPASPRRADAPYAFTRTEFLGGVGRAWLATTLLLVAAWGVVTGGAGVFAIFVILPASAVALALGAPGAYALGRRLRSSPRAGVHVAAFASYGALVGSVTTVLFVLTITRDPNSSWLALGLLLVNTPVSAIGVAGAWLRTAQQCPRVDAGPAGAPNRRGDPDAAVEDGIDERVRVIDPRQRPRR